MIANVQPLLFFSFSLHVELSVELFQDQNNGSNGSVQTDTWSKIPPQAGLEESLLPLVL